MNPIWVIGSCLAAGAAVGLAWVPLVPVFGQRSVEALDQPGWTRLFASPLFLAGVCAALFTAAALRLTRSRAWPRGCSCARCSSA